MLSRLCELEAEIAKSLTLSHEVAHARLTWWQEECERLAAGSPRHPLTQGLAAQLPAPTNLTGLIDTAVWDLAGATFETRREVTAYCERWAAALMEPAAHEALGHPPGMRWRALGAAVREIELLAHVHPEAQAGRLRLPLDELARAHVAPEALNAASCPPAAVELLCARHEALRRSLETAVEVPPSEQPALRGLLVWVQLAWRLSREAQRALPAWLARDAGGGWAYGWAAWRAARAAQRGAYRLQ